MDKLEMSSSMLLFVLICFNISAGRIINSICYNIQVINRATWGARSPTDRTTFNYPVKFFFIHHTDGNTCHSEAECAKVLQSIQNYHMDERHYSDIAYSFLIGEDGRVYEGRGWGVVGAHTLHYNNISYGVAFMGNFMRILPSASALNAAKALIQCGVNKGHIRANYDLLGHRDVGNTDCPGDRLYKEIRTWKNYNNTGSVTIQLF